MSSGKTRVFPIIFELIAARSFVATPRIVWRFHVNMYYPEPRPEEPNLEMEVPLPWQILRTR